MARSLRPADHLLAPAVAATLRELDLTELDSATAKLAGQYARAIDDADPEDRPVALRDLGPKLLACLVELGATPRARAAVKDGSAADAGTSSLARLREARRV